VLDSKFEEAFNEALSGARNSSIFAKKVVWKVFSNIPRNQATITIRNVKIF
jgi:hypothetical protein